MNYHLVLQLDVDTIHIFSSLISKILLHDYAKSFVICTFMDVLSVLEKDNLK